MKVKHLLIMALLLPCFVSAKVTTEPVDTFRLRETKANYIGEIKIDVDGKLDEPAWHTADWQGDFIQRTPNDGTPGTYPTEFSVLYDNEYLYIGARAYDPNPDKISAILSRRDDYTESDWMYVSIDSYNDNRTAFEFGLNAAGVKHDVRRFDDGNADFEWDAVWDGDAHIDEKGWTAEFRIPFRELRFTSNDSMEWGIQMYRELPRLNNELSVWNHWRQSEEGFVSRYGVLNGLSNIKVKNPIYFVPYIAGQADVSDNLVNSVHEKNYDLFSHLGGDLRYSNQVGLTLNATLNPDFGQVESDPADFNLTEFETYFNEKRPFFMEGANILRFQLGFGDGDNSANSLFYSRRIGRTPQGYLQTDNNKEVVSTARPEMTNILGAAKITGKSSGGLSIGMMEAVTVQEKGTVYYSDGSRDLNVIEPLTNYWLGRLQQDFNGGQTSIGGILTAVNRRLDDTGIDYLHREAYSGGVDVDHEFLDRKYSFIGTFSFSNVKGDTTAIQLTQRRSSRYFNRVDADHLEYDPQATSLAGYSGKAILTKNTGHIRAATGVISYSPGFEINDIGYIRSVDNISQFVWVQFYEWEQLGFLRQFRINFNQWANWDFSGLRTNLGGNVNMHFTFNNNWDFGYGINRGFGSYSPSMNRGGPMLYVPKYWNFWNYISTDARKNLIFELTSFYFTNPDKVHSWEIEPELTWRPKRNLQLSATMNYDELDDTWAWIGKAIDHNDETRYIWSCMQQKTLTLTLRADFTLTTNLSIQYYAQPFFTAGHYFDFLELADPKAVDYDQRFTHLGDQIHYDTVNGEYVVDEGNNGQIDYTFGGYTDFNFKQFRSNLVLRWEYMTGSVMYLVWSQGYTDYESFRRFDFPRDTRTLFDGVGDNVFMIKISQMLNL